MLITISSDKPLAEVAEALDAAAKARHFGVMQVHDLKKSMTKKGVKFDRECLICEICQPEQAKRVLEENMDISTALPCRISLYEEGGKTILSTIKPTQLILMFQASGLEDVAKEVESAIEEIMKEAAQ